MHTLNLVDAGQRDRRPLLLFGVEQVASPSMIQMELVVQVRLVVPVAQDVEAVLVAVGFERQEETVLDGRQWQRRGHG